MKKYILSIITITALGFEANAQWTEINQNIFEGVQKGAVAFADIDGDNDQDVLIIGDNGSQRIAKLYTNNGSGIYTEIMSTPFLGVDYCDAKFADIDGDNDQDVLITGMNGSQKIAKLYTNDGSGSFTEVIGTPIEGVSRSAIAFGDIDGDNDLDVLITGSTATSAVSTKLYTNNGSGGFTLVTGTTFIDGNDGDIAFADVDGDNDLDVFIAGGDQVNTFGSSTLYINNGSGVFTAAPPSVFNGVRLSSIAFADVDGDNDLDLIIAGQGTLTTRLYLNNGTGAFSLAVGTSFDGVKSCSVAFADVDNDNDQDLLITGAKSSTNDPLTKLYTNNGSGTFTLVTGSPFDNVANSSIAFTDIDGDNDPDLIITGYNGSGYISKMYSNSAIVGLLEGMKSIELPIYPNPTTTQLTINTTEQIKSINILDVSGKTVKIITPSNNTINVSDLTNGIYFLQIETENGIVTNRFIKE